MALLLCVVAVVGILPFAVIRLLRGELVMAAVDVVLVAGISGLGGYAWLTGSSRTPLAVLALFYSSADMVVPYIIGQAGFYWIYPGVIANYFMLSPRIATLVNGVIILSVLPAGLSMMPAIEVFSLLVTLSVVALFTFIFSQRTARQRRRLDQLAFHDPLTQVGNRRLLEREMALAIARWNRHRVPASIILLDLDRFKAINDTFGHETGDRFLVRLADIIRQRIRETDQLIRYGGEEFVVLTPDTRLAQAALLAEHLRELIREQLVADGAPVTASFGCAELASGETSESWLSRADAALYRAKNAGRDRVKLAQ